MAVRGIREWVRVNMPTSTLFGQPAAPASISSDSGPYTMGVQFSVSVAATLNAIWFYSAPGAGVLAGTIALYQVTGQSLIHSELAAWSGAAGSGWVRSAFTTPPALSAGVAYKAVFLNGDGVHNWYSGSSHYWDTGPGSSGVTNGPLTAPGNSGSAEGQDSFNSGGSLVYPAGSFNATNYWVDVEVSVSAATVNADAFLTFLP